MYNSCDNLHDTYPHLPPPSLPVPLSASVVIYILLFGQHGGLEMIPFVDPLLSVCQSRRHEQLLRVLCRLCQHKGKSHSQNENYFQADRQRWTGRTRCIQMDTDNGRCLRVCWVDSRRHGGRGCMLWWRCSRPIPQILFVPSVFKVAEFSCCFLLGIRELVPKASKCRWFGFTFPRAGSPPQCDCMNLELRAQLTPFVPRIVIDVAVPLILRQSQSRNLWLKNAQIGKGDGLHNCRFGLIPLIRSCVSCFRYHLTIFFWQPSVLTISNVWKRNSGIQKGIVSPRCHWHLQR